MADILVVDDDGEELEIITETIKTFDPRLECLCFSQPDEAIDYLSDDSNAPPLCIFIDFHIPKLNGKELLGVIRSLPGTDSIPIAIFSTAMHDRQREEFMNCGADFVFSKPNNFEDYVAIVGRVVSAVRAS